MAKYKTAKQIMRKSSFNGADIGKLITIGNVEFLVNGDNSIINNASTLIETKRQQFSNTTARIDNLKIEMVYKGFAQFISTLYPVTRNIFERYKHSIYCIDNILFIIKPLQFRYINFLSTPLIVSRYGIEEIKSKALREYRKNHKDDNATSDNDAILDYYKMLPPKNMTDFIKLSKIRNGICVLEISKDNKPIETQNYEIKKYSKDGWYGGKDTIKILSENTLILKDTFKELFMLNGFFDVYSDILEVDLTPLKMDMNFEEDFARPTETLKNIYSEIVGTGEQIKSEIQQFSTIFDFSDITNTEPYEKKVLDLKNTISKLPLEDILDEKYIQAFMSGGSINAR